MATALAHLPPLLPPQATAHPAFDPLRDWLTRLGECPGLDDLNALADASAYPPVTAAGRPVRFCPPASISARQYEQRVFDSGQVGTRADNLHDFFNALAWLAFPRTKAAINARHVERIASEGTVRGPLRDLLTLVDECGVVVACADASLAGFEALVRAFSWQELFWERREALVAEARFVLLGHSVYEKALNPYPGITCKAVFVPVSRARLDGPASGLAATLDTAVAEWTRTLPKDARPRQLAPLPVFGYPGWLPESAHPRFYADRRWFRAAPAGNPPTAKVGHPA